MRRTFTIALAFVAALLPIAASATDTWTNVRPGIDWLHRTVGGATPQDIHAVRIDLTRPQIGLRASRDVRGSERGVVTSTFASNVGAVVAINGDWSDGVTPVGLAIGNGQQWHSHFDNPAIGGQWGYLGCDIFNECDIEFLPRLSEVPDFAEPTRAPHYFFNAVGGNGNPLLDDGARGVGCFDGCSGDTCRNPRSAACLDASGDTLWLIVVDGRRASSGAAGMTCGEMRDLVTELGCNRATMLDGGGSSTIWIDGAVRNQPSDGSQRSVSNHFGVVYTATPEAACSATPSGAYCSGTEINVCTGGRLVSEGDCGAFGLACAARGGRAFCVDPRCPGGDAWGVACADSTVIGTCEDGVYSEGDCGVFGLSCGTDSSGTSCMDGRCRGPNSSHCTTGGRLASCDTGAYSEASCGVGTECAESGESARCEPIVVPPDPDPDPDPDTPDAGGHDGDAGGADVRPSDLGDPGDIAAGPDARRRDAAGDGSAAGDAAADDDTPTVPDRGLADGPSEDPGGNGASDDSARAERDVTHVRVGGCSTVPVGGAATAPLLVCLFGLLALIRRARTGLSGRDRLRRS